jgi:hydrogenase expression/formation protein HypC
MPMCLAVPGRILDVAATDDPVTGSVATVDFQGSRMDISLAMTPEAGPGDWVLVHAGFALTVLDEADARETWEYLEMGGLGEMPPELKAGRSDGPEAAGADRADAENG